MQKKSCTINGDLLKEKPEKLASYTGKFIQKAVEDKSSYPSKFQELPKENSFTSTSTSDSEESGHTYKSQNCCGLLCLSLALAASITGCYVMWGTDLFTLIVHQNLVISNNSMRYEAWKSPPVQALFRVYLFNYTNVKAFEAGIDAKLKIEELGPYSYKEKLERVDVRFNKNGTATYRDKKTYRFSQKHSQGNESDIITVPNLPFLAAMSFISELHPFFRWSLLSIINSIGGQPFISLKVSEFLWGYEDHLSVLAQKLLAVRYDLPFKKFGILSAKNQTQKDLVTIYTGEEDSSMTGIVACYDGRTSLNYWHSSECNRIDGTDGTIYPPALVHPNSTLYIYSKDFCRKMPLVYSRQYQDKHGIPVMRFHIPKTVFSYEDVQKKNLCFCTRNENKIKCLPSGIFNVSPCTFEAPIVTSLPHFLFGDPKLTEGIEGLNPKVIKHESFVEVDPKMGIPVGGKSRLQLNILAGREFGTYAKNFIYKRQVVFPFAWMDYGVDRLPDDISAMIRSLLSFIKVAEFALSYGFIISTIVLALFVITNSCQVFRNQYYDDNLKSAGETPLVIIHEKR